jgi:integrase
LLLVAIFCGLRASELRGLRWTDVDFDARQINVAQRADASHKIGRLKSRSAYRATPLPPIVLNALREWKLVCPKGDLGLVFPNGRGKVESHSNIIEHGFGPIQIAAGVVNSDGGGRYGMHALRHACASLWIENGHNPKQIMTLMGHSSIQMTYDVYGHLFADAEGDQKAAEDIQVRLLGK